MYAEWMDRLLQVELFKNMKKNELENILSCLNPEIKHYNKNEIITIEKDKLTGIGIVLDGQVVIGKETLAGDRVIISRLDKGHLFGEVAAFVGDQWLATVVAHTECSVLFFPPDKIIGVCTRMCEGHRKLIENMLQIVARKALILNKKVEMLSLKSIREKISTYLLEQYHMKKNLTFDIPLKRHELAEYLVVSRPSLSRELIYMKNEGIIDFHMNTFRIVNLESLKGCL